MRNGTVRTSQIFFTINKLELQTSRDPNCSNYLILIDLKMRHHLIDVDAYLVDRGSVVAVLIFKAVNLLLNGLDAVLYSFNTPLRRFQLVLHQLNITFNVDEPAIQDALMRSFLLHRFRQFLEFGNLRFLHDHISKSSNRQGEHTFLFKRSSKS